MEIENIKVNKIYVTSDTHFSHYNIIKYCNRPYSNITEMNEKLIYNWNTLVTPDDLVFHLGDIQMSSSVEELNSIISRLNGKKILILGNHDYCKIEDYYAAGFIKVDKYYELLAYNNKFFMSHYQMMTWNNSHKGSINLYGHEHDRQQKIPNHEIYSKLHISERKFNVCVDANNYKPIDLKEIIKQVQNRDINTNF